MQYKSLAFLLVIFCFALQVQSFSITLNRRSYLSQYQTVNHYDSPEPEPQQQPEEVAPSNTTNTTNTTLIDYDFQLDSQNATEGNDTSSSGEDYNEEDTILEDNPQATEEANESFNDQNENNLTNQSSESQETAEEQNVQSNPEETMNQDQNG